MRAEVLRLGPNDALIRGDMATFNSLFERAINLRKELRLSGALRGDTNEKREAPSDVAGLSVGVASSSSMAPTPAAASPTTKIDVAVKVEGAMSDAADGPAGEHVPDMSAGTGGFVYVAPMPKFIAAPPAEIVAAPTALDEDAAAHGAEGAAAGACPPLADVAQELAASTVSQGDSVFPAPGPVPGPAPGPAPSPTPSPAPNPARPDPRPDPASVPDPGPVHSCHLYRAGHSLEPHRGTEHSL